jgi:hypothetical protein
MAFVAAVSNSPKLGTAHGGVAGYMRKFDKESQVSIFGASAQHTSTDSATAVLFARTSFDEDHHRIHLLGMRGVVKNDYDERALPSSRRITSARSWALPIPREVRRVCRCASARHGLPDCWTDAP